MIIHVKFTLVFYMHKSRLKTKIRRFHKLRRSEKGANVHKLRPSLLDAGFEVLFMYFGISCWESAEHYLLSLRNQF